MFRTNLLDTTHRTIIKAITWQLVGILSMLAISYWHTGSLLSALSLAVSASATGLLFYFVHEKIWNAVQWGRKSA